MFVYVLDPALDFWFSEVPKEVAIKTEDIATINAIASEPAIINLYTEYHFQGNAKHSESYLVFNFSMQIRVFSDIL